MLYSRMDTFQDSDFWRFERAGALFRSFLALRAYTGKFDKYAWRHLRKLYKQAIQEGSIATYLRFMAAIGTVAYEQVAPHLEEVYLLLAKYIPQKAPA